MSNGPAIRIVRYRTAKDCLAAYHCCKPSEIPKAGHWIFWDRGGVRRQLTVKSCMKELRRRGCWGWVENKRVLHLWVSARASAKEVIKLLAHELGHCEKPYGSRKMEEIKAGKYERVADAAFRIFRSDFFR